MRLIDADKLPEHKFTYKSAKGSDFMRGWNHAIDTIIDNAPTVERPHGEWIYHKGLSESRECSVCGVWLDWSLVRNSFCPNCGADMRVKDELNRVKDELNNKLKEAENE